MIKYDFRQATIEDIDEIAQMYQNAIDNMIQHGIFQWDEIYPSVEVLLEDIMKKEMHLLIVEDIIVASIVLNEEQDISYDAAPWEFVTEERAVIHRLCVLPESQKAGFGTKTMHLAEELLRGQGYAAIRLDTFSQNLYARHLYERLGYSYVGEVQFRKGMFYLMEKSLID